MNADIKRGLKFQYPFHEGVDAFGEEILGYEIAEIISIQPKELTNRPYGIRLHSGNCMWLTPEELKEILENQSFSTSTKRLSYESS